MLRGDSLLIVAGAMPRRMRGTSDERDAMSKCRMQITRRFVARDSKTSMPFDVLEYTRMTLHRTLDGSQWVPGDKLFRLAATGEICTELPDNSFKTSLSARLLHPV